MLSANESVGRMPLANGVRRMRASNEISRVPAAVADNTRGGMPYTVDTPGRMLVADSAS
jgi:hypothetical protein